MYNIESLKNGIKQAKQNIKSFEDAIEKEKKTIKDYRGFIKDIEKKKKFMEEVEVNVEVERD